MENSTPHSIQPTEHLTVSRHYLDNNTLHLVVQMNELAMELLWDTLTVDNTLSFVVVVDYDDGDDADDDCVDAVLMVCAAFSLDNKTLSPFDFVDLVALGGIFFSLGNDRIAVVL